MVESNSVIGFVPALPLLAIGVGSFGLSILVTVLMILKYVILPSRRGQRVSTNDA